MGVWERSPAGLELARANAGCSASFRDALPDLRDRGRHRVAVLRAPLRGRRAASAARPGWPRPAPRWPPRGVRLILDYVPNHVAPDHPWVTEHPECFVQGDDDDVAADPAGWLRGRRARARPRPRPVLPAVAGRRAARTRSPPACGRRPRTRWSTSPDQCDGIRCDMAMLMINDVFAQTWGEPGRAAAGRGVLAGRASPRLRERHPETVLIAEAYWDTGVDAAAAGLRLLLRQAALRPDPRARTRPTCAGTCAPASTTSRACCASSRTTTSRGSPASCLPAPRAGRGRHHRDAARRDACGTRASSRAGACALPVFLGRRPDEPPDAALAAWYRDLVRQVGEHRVRTGAWQLLEASGLARQPVRAEPDRLVLDPGDDAGDAGGTWSWSTSPVRTAQAQVPLPWPDLPGRRWSLTDLLSGEDFVRDGGELAEPGAVRRPRPGAVLPAGGRGRLGAPPWARRGGPGAAGRRPGRAGQRRQAASPAGPPASGW